MTYWTTCKSERECTGNCPKELFEIVVLENSLNPQENNSEKILSKDAYYKPKPLLNFKKDSVGGVAETIQHIFWMPIGPETTIFHLKLL